MEILSLPLRPTQAPPPRIVRIRLHPLDGSHPIPLVSIGTIDAFAQWVERTGRGVFVRCAGGGAFWVAPSAMAFWVEENLR